MLIGLSTVAAEISHRMQDIEPKAGKEVATPGLLASPRTTKAPLARDAQTKPCLPEAIRPLMRCVEVQAATINQQSEIQCGGGTGNQI